MVNFVRQLERKGFLPRACVSTSVLTLKFFWEHGRSTAYPPHRYLFLPSHINPRNAVLHVLYTKFKRKSHA